MFAEKLLMIIISPDTKPVKYFVTQVNIQDYRLAGLYNNFWRVKVTIKKFYTEKATYIISGQDRLRQNKKTSCKKKRGIWWLV